MKCQTKIGPDNICGHSVTSHDGDESGMGGPEPCNMCGCANFTRREQTLAEKQHYATQEAQADRWVPSDAERIRHIVSNSMGPLQPGTKCPTCESNAPERHPAVQFEGEVSICQDTWHRSTPEGRAMLMHAVAAEQAGGIAEATRKSAEGALNIDAPLKEPTPMVTRNESKFVTVVDDGFIETVTTITFYPKEKK